MKVRSVGLDGQFVQALELLKGVAADPVAYLDQWKARNERPIVGVFPMNFPTEIVHAAGAHPVIVQESDAPVTVGNKFLTEFHCGYTRSLADQAGTDGLDIYDAFVLADHCIQLFGAGDVIREYYPDTPMFFSQLISAMSDPWTDERVDATMRELLGDLERFTGKVVSADDMHRSVQISNENRRLLRTLFVARREGRGMLSATDLQALVKSSMIMDKEEHSAALRTIVAAVGVPDDTSDRIKVHLSGHFCHAPKPELLDLIEDSGAVVVDDDLYFGFRYISTDIPEGLDPIEGLSAWYLDRNTTVPCPTRVQNDVNWDSYLLSSVEKSGAEAVIVLMAKFCEPHMLYYPELKKALTERGVPHILIETEHEGLPAESTRTRVEAMLERLRRNKRGAAAASGSISLQPLSEGAVS